MVMNIGKLRSGELAEVEADVRAVVETAHPLPVKVIIEVMYLTREETQQACEICVSIRRRLRQNRHGLGGSRHDP